MLLERGFEVTILEARERIGGRLYQVTLSSGHVVDMGPNWIHGTAGNPILDLAKKANTPTHSVRAFLFDPMHYELLTEPKYLLIELV